jgi:DNA-binding NtrC family response regulator
MSRRLLVIGNDEASCRLIEAAFQAEGFEVLVADDGPAGVAQVSADHPDLVLLDFELLGLHAIEVLEQLKTRTPSLPIVMITASGDVRTAVRATRLGAFDYLTKPIDHDELLLVVARALDVLALQIEVEDLRKRLVMEEADNLAVQMGSGASIQRLVEQVKTVAASNFTVLISGETGTGKELVAHAIHKQSTRHRKPFIALDCGAIPDQLLESELFGHEKGAFTGADRRTAGRFQIAEAGTCFLDEISNLAVGLQPKLLRALESKEVQPIGAERATSIDIRFIAATNHDLQSLVAEGQFRADLFFRLAQYTITVPPLRQRPDDIEYLAHRFIQEAGVELRRPVQALLPAASVLLKQYNWPGNVRELRNVVRQAVLQTNELVIRPADLQAAWTSSRSATPSPRREADGKSLKEIADEAAQAAERQAIGDALRATKGNKSDAARALKTDYKTLHLKMKHLGIDARDFIS